MTTSRVAFRPADFFVIRSPLLSSAETRSSLALLDDPVVVEALRRASPDLLDALHDPKGVSHAARTALTRYVGRMRNRATPFSLMAGYSMGTVVGTESHIELAARGDYERVVRCSNAWLAHRQNSLARPARWIRRADLVLLPDVARKTERDPKTGVELATDIALTPAVVRLLEAARRPASAEELVAVVAAAEAPGPIHEEYVELAIEAGLLVRADAPALHMDDELTALAELDPAFVATARRARCTRLGRADGAVVEALERLVPDEVPEPTIVDLKKPVLQATLGRDVMGPLARIIDVLRVVGERTEDRRLERFARRFTEAYGCNRNVPLLEALDARRGLGFPRREERMAAHVPKVEAWRLRLFERAARRGERSVELNDLPLPDTEGVQMPESFSVTFQLLRDPWTIVDPRTTGAPGTHLFARATALDAELRERTRAHLRTVAETAPGYDFTDLACAFDATLDVAQHPRLQPYDIGLSAVATTDGAIDANDVLVRVDAQGQLELTHARTGRLLRVRPTGALNTDHFDVGDVAAFLFALQERHRGSLAFGWSSLPGAAFYPQVTYAGHQLSAARWSISSEYAARLAKGALAGRRDVAERLRRDLQLPRHVHFRRGYDHVMLVDFEDPESVEAWLDAPLPENPYVTAAPPPERSAVRGPEGPYAHELVVPMCALGKTPAPAASSPATGTSARPRAPFGETFELRLDGDPHEIPSLVRDVVTSYVLDIPPARRRAWQVDPLSPRAARVVVHASAEALWAPERMNRLHALLDSWSESGTLSRATLTSHDDQAHGFGGARGAELAASIAEASSRMMFALGERLELAPWAPLTPEVCTALVRGHARFLRSAELDDPDAMRVIEWALDRVGSAERTLVHRRGGALYRADQAIYRESAALSETSPTLQGHFSALRLAHAGGEVVGETHALLGASLAAHAKRTWLVEHDDTSAHLVPLDLLHRCIASRRARVPRPTSSEGAS